MTENLTARIPKILYTYVEIAGNTRHILTDISLSAIIR